MNTSKISLMLLLSIIVGSSNLQSKAINLALSAGAAALMYYNADKFQQAVGLKAVKLKNTLKDCLSDSADVLQKKMPDIQKVAGDISSGKSKLQGKNCISKWWSKTKAEREAAKTGNQAVDGLNNMAHDLNDMSSQEVISSVNQNYTIIKGVFSFLTFCVTNKLLNKINK